jgi:hypothetical protein
VVTEGVRPLLEYLCCRTKIVCKSYDPREVDVSTTPIGAHKPFGVSSPRVRVLDV